MTEEPMRDLESLVDVTKAVGIVWEETEDGAERCRNERADQAERERDALAAALREIRDETSDPDSPSHDVAAAALARLSSSG